MAIIIYSKLNIAKENLPNGQVFLRNPEYWRGEVEKAEKVIVYGEYPQLIKAYMDAEIKVEKAKNDTKATGATKPETPPVTPPDESTPFDLETLSKDELKTNLTARGIEFKANASVKALQALLTDAIAKEAENNGSENT